MFENEGTFYKSGSSDALPVVVRFHEEFVTLFDKESNQALETFNRKEFKVKSKLGSLPREIQLSGRGELVVPSNEATDNWLAKSGSARTARLESSLTAVLISIVLVPVVIFATFKYVIPALAIEFAAYVPQDAKILASQHTLQSLDYTVLNESELDAETDARIRESFSELLRKVNLNEDDYSLHFRTSEHFGPNAFALPDGTIVMMDELIQELDYQDNLINAILLHEIGHVEHNHSMQLIAESLAIAVALNFVLGDLGGLTEVFAGLSGSLAENQYSQKHEWEADNFAIRLMSENDLDPNDFANAMRVFLEYSAGETSASALFSTHPMTQERIDNAEAQAKAQE